MEESKRKKDECLAGSSVEDLGNGDDLMVEVLGTEVYVSGDNGVDQTTRVVGNEGLLVVSEPVEIKNVEEVDFEMESVELGGGVNVEEEVRCLETENCVGETLSGLEEEERGEREIGNGGSEVRVVVELESEVTVLTEVVAVSEPGEPLSLKQEDERMEVEVRVSEAEQVAFNGGNESVVVSGREIPGDLKSKEDQLEDLEVKEETSTVQKVFESQQEASGDVTEKDTISLHHHSQVVGSEDLEEMSFNWDAAYLAKEEARAEGVTVAESGVTSADPGSSSAPPNIPDPIIPEVEREVSPEVVTTKIDRQETTVEEVVDEAFDHETMTARRDKRRAEKRPSGSRPPKRPAPSRAHTMVLSDDVISSLPSPLRVFYEQVASGYDMRAWHRASRVDPVGSAKESVSLIGQSLLSLLGSLSAIKTAFDETAVIVEASQEKSIKLEAAEKGLAEMTEAKAHVEAKLVKCKDGLQAIRKELKGQKERIAKLSESCSGLLHDKAELLTEVQSQEGVIDQVNQELSEATAKIAALEGTVESLTTGLATSPGYVEGMRSARAKGREQAGIILVKMIKDKYPDLNLEFLYAPRG